MTLYNRYEQQYRRVCPLARTFAQIADQSIFAKITEQTTQEQFAKAQQSLLQLCQRLEAQLISSTMLNPTAHRIGASGICIPTLPHILRT
jgi:hypothetical protein